MKMKADKIKFCYQDTAVFDELSLEIEKGKIISLVGPNGIGKSTLIKCLSNIYQADSGFVYLDGKNTLSIEAKELAKELGYVPQTQRNSFSISVYESILLGRKPYFNWKVRQEDKIIVEEILEKLNLQKLAEREVSNLSGGEMQKVAIARSLAQKPSIFLLDEPTSNLDLNHQLEVMNIITELAKEENAAVVMAIHDLNLAARFSDYIFLIAEKGKYISGKAEEVFTEENMEATYGVKVEIVESSKGMLIMPIELSS
ncbi:MAG: ABC transporter ATP-binding protein [Halanaerobium sp. MSAO_Bac5]|nr:MAG: ABC transporter ATP-binding protein [Halanaerobium sp. MSAO_Bac5]